MTWPGMSTRWWLSSRGCIRCRYGWSSWPATPRGTWRSGSGRPAYLEQAPRRLPWKAARWVPANPDWAYAPLTRACRAAAPGRSFYPGHAVLAGLAEACGLGFRMTGLLPAGGSVVDATRQLDMQLQNLISVTQTVAGAAVLAHRT